MTRITTTRDKTTVPSTRSDRCSEGTPLPDWTLECLSRLFSALGDPTRLTILRSLAEIEGSICVSDLAANTQLSLSAVSHQLRLLRDRNLVMCRRNGRMVHYALADEHVRTLIEVGLEHAREDCANRPRD